MPPTTSYVRDLAQEKIFAEFLYQCLYQPIVKIIQALGRVIAFHRITDLDMQHAGIDMVYRHGDTIINIDEKSQLHNLNQNLPTFAFELSYLKQGQERVGWLLDVRKKTQGYMLCWPREEKDEYGGLYLGAKVIFLSKRRLLSFLSGRGYDKTCPAPKIGRDTAGKYPRPPPCGWGGLLVLPYSAEGQWPIL